MSTRHKRTVLTTTLLVFALVIGGSAIAPGSARADIDFRILNQQAIDAQNRGDVAAATAYYSDDAVVRGGEFCQPVPCVGKAAIQREIQRRVNNHTQVTIVSLQESSGSGVGRYRIIEDSFRACSIQRIFVNFSVVVKNDKITSFIAGPDLSDPQTAAYIACVAAAAAPAAPTPVVRPPATGDGGLVVDQ